MPEQEKSVWNNQNLFSNNYLEHRLQLTSLWDAQKERVNKIFEDVKNVHETIKSLNLGPGEEAGLEDKFIRPVLTLLGYEWDVHLFDEIFFLKVA
ncbi:MAG: hypothetical protein A2069_03330 [Planctomycetes bacterium GWB2_41_19]|nr:MAG: hypothetical protein A2069_03330 [Planctomycetes bacterium GWB2_41_19]